MRIDEILSKIDTVSDFESLLNKIRIQLGCRRYSHAFEIMSKVIGVHHKSMCRWLDGNRQITSQTMRSLQLLDLLLRMSNNYQEIPIREIPVLDNKINKGKQKGVVSSEEEASLSVEDILEEMDFD